MKYDDLYPDATDMWRAPKTLNGLIPGVIHYECKEPTCKATHACNCGVKTHWVNVTLGSFVCSEECNQKMWDSIVLLFCIAMLGRN